MADEKGTIVIKRINKGVKLNLGTIRQASCG
jgi:hypothetical protein